MNIDYICKRIQTEYKLKTIYYEELSKIFTGSTLYSEWV